MGSRSSGPGYSGSMDSPPARRQDLVDVLHGVEVADPYRWLEDPSSDETARWGEAQDDLARPYLDGLPGRDVLRGRLRELLSAGLVTVPVLRRHRVGADPATDDLVFGEGFVKTVYRSLGLSLVGRWLLVAASWGCAPGND